MKSFLAGVVIFLESLIAVGIFLFILGDPSHFQGNDPANNPLQGDYLGIVYKGGYVVPLLIAFLMIVITFGIERSFTVSKARGRKNVDGFVLRIRSLISASNIAQAVKECDKQRGSVANVVRAGLVKYNELSRNYDLDLDKKVLLIQKDIEETTQLEMPMLERNLGIISTIASISTLVGLFGTVLGMIKAFAALATTGAPDTVQLANGISEALINTALGIATSAIAIVLYNFFTKRIDSLTYAIDEASFSILQNFTAQSNRRN